MRSDAASARRADFALLWLRRVACATRESTTSTARGSCPDLVVVCHDRHDAGGLIARVPEIELRSASSGGSEVECGSCRLRGVTGGGVCQFWCSDRRRRGWRVQCSESRRCRVRHRHVHVRRRQRVDASSVDRRRVDERSAQRSTEPDAQREQRDDECAREAREAGGSTHVSSARR